MRFKQILGLLILGVLVTSCATLEKKFVKHREFKEAKPVIFTEDEFVKEYSHKYYYKMHFSYWKTWHDEILSSLGSNTKRARRSADEAVSHLSEMAQYLNPEWRAKLESEISKLKQARQDLEVTGNQKAKLGALQQEFERAQRRIQSQYYYEKVKEHVLPDMVEL